MEYFELGKMDKIFIFIYSYFMVGYLILFTTYEQNFIGLQLWTQILLSIGISLPIMTISMALMGMNTKVPDKTKGVFYQLASELLVTSIAYSSFFSLFYILKHFIYDGNEFSPIIAVAIIIISLGIFWKIGLGPKKP